MSSILSNLKPAAGAVKKSKRIARGQGSGHGGTSTRGHKGDGSRSGSKRKRAHEGGQTPIQRRMPKRGFKNINRIEYLPINLSELQRLVEKHGLSSIDHETLRKLNIAGRTEKVKVLGNGTLTAALNVTLHGYSEKAKQAIESAGGTANVIGKAQVNVG
jgi:large subunit ribosomal protein L15